MVEDKYKFKVDSFVLLSSLRYAIGRSDFALNIVGDNIKNNLADLPNDVLNQMKEELIQYYKDRQEDDNYLVARKIIIMIKDELYGKGAME